MAEWEALLEDADEAGGVERNCHELRRSLPLMIGPDCGSRSGGTSAPPAEPPNGSLMTLMID